MGESTIWSVSADAEAKQIVARWQRDFSTMVGGNRSRLLCIAIKTLDRLGFTAERLVEALNAPQRIRLENEQQALANLNNLSQVSAAFPGEQKKPLVRVGPSKTGSHQRREFAYISRTVSMATVPSGITFFPKHLHLNSTRIDGRVA